GSARVGETFGLRGTARSKAMTRLNKHLALGAASALALSLAACNDTAKKPADQAALADTSASTQLPPARPAPVAPRPPARAYAWAERAYGMQQSVYDAPPDYGFEYEGIEPMVWETADDWSMYAEPWEDSYRYYYYEPGAAYPYFVRDRDYGYGYDPHGELIAVFDSGGRYLRDETLVRVAPVAGRYFERGRELRRVGLQAPRAPVAQQVWSTAAPRLSRSADPWLRAARNDTDWQAWRDRDGNRELQRFRAEQQRREEIRRTAPTPGLDLRRADLGREQELRRGEMADLRAQQMTADRARMADAQAQAQRQQQAARVEDMRQREGQARAQAERQQQAERLQARDEQARVNAQRQIDRQHEIADRQRAHDEQVRAAQAAQSQRQQQMAERQQAHEQQARAQQVEAAQRQQQMAERQRAHDEQARAQQAQAAQRQQQMAERQRAHDEQARAQQVQAAQRQQQMERQQQQQQARAAEQAARQAAAHERAAAAQRGNPKGDKDKRHEGDDRPQ
ncbi:MAG TPA: hypothetical protein VFH92_09475, partial [Phenylobacterium sp.]|nr:hypothetical protein [Phenylobacterium sp.]